METEEVRAMILERLRGGVLPRAPADKLYGGAGSDTTCCCCDRPIPRDQVEFDVEFAAIGADAGTAGDRRIVMHRDCLRLWYDESEI